MYVDTTPSPGGISRVYNDLINISGGQAQFDWSLFNALFGNIFKLVRFCNTSKWTHGQHYGLLLMCYFGRNGSTIISCDGSGKFNTLGSVNRLVLCVCVLVAYF